MQASTLPSISIKLPIPKNKIPRKEFISVLIVLACAIGFRLILSLYNFPYTDSEEGTFAIEAMHIMKGDLPIWMYGQNYMGVAESYLGALMFHIFGVSVFAMRIGMLLFFSTFLVLVYFLGRTLYGHIPALVSLIALIGANDTMIIPQMKAVGGVEEILVSGSLCMLLASWLALSINRPNPPQRWKRIFAYVGWGLSAGFGLWSHMLIAPFIFCSGFLLLLFCRREFFTVLVPSAIVGFTIGAWPLIYYNLHAPLSESTPMVLYQLYNYKPNVHPTLFQKLANTVDYTLPLVTNIPNIHVGIDKLTWRIILFQSAWGIGYLALLLISTFFAYKNIRMYLLLRKEHGSLEASNKYHLVLEVARALLILSAFLTIALFALSSNAALRPWSFRYLSGLMITNIVVLEPLVRLLSKYRYIKYRAVKYAGVVLALILIVTSVIDTIQVIQAVPIGDNRISDQAALIVKLRQLGVKNFYSGYWICDNIIFQSQEEFTCGIVGTNLKPQLTRYRPYGKMVADDPNAAYVFPMGSYEKEMKILDSNARYQRTSVRAFIIYYVKPS